MLEQSEEGVEEMRAEVCVSVDKMSGRAGQGDAVPYKLRNEFAHTGWN